MSKFEFPIIQVKNLPYNNQPEDLFELFGKYGNIHQIRAADPKQNAPLGTCFVVYKNLSSAQEAAKRINGINYQGRYLVAMMYQVNKSKLSEEDYTARMKELSALKEQHNIE